MFKVSLQNILGDALWQVRKSRRLTQQAVAKLGGVAVPTIRLLERGGAICAPGLRYWTCSAWSWSGAICLRVSISDGRLRHFANVEGWDSGKWLRWWGCLSQP